MTTSFLIAQIIINTVFILVISLFFEGINRKYNRNSPFGDRKRYKQFENSIAKNVSKQFESVFLKSEAIHTLLSEIFISIFAEMFKEDESEIGGLTPERTKEIESATTQATIELFTQENPMIAFLGRRLYGEDWNKVLQERPEEISVILTALEKTGLSRLFSSFGQGVQTNPNPVVIRQPNNGSYSIT